MSEISFRLQQFQGCKLNNKKKREKNTFYLPLKGNWQYEKPSGYF